VLRKASLVLPLGAIAAGVLLGKGGRAHAEDADKTERNERCATRLSLSLLGKSATPEFMASTTPQDQVERMLGTPEFNERMASFLNATFNTGPGANAEDDAVYFLAKYTLEQGKPHRDLFVGGYRVDKTETSASVVPDAAGLGYFRSRGWQVRYAGNESEGVKIVTAYRMLSNVLGFEMPATTAKPGEDRTATGRQAPECKGCHFDEWFALDKMANVLTKRKGMGETMTFVASTEGPQQLFGKSVKDDKELVTAMVDSDGWKFAQCRNVFKFLYGRQENQCEAPLFDKCVEALETKGTLKSAVAVVAQDPSFCQ
jgi:hypothetical protein